MKKTVLHDNHVKLGAKMVEFAGYHMPISYTSITEEHMAVRDRAGVFDVSHMGEIVIIGEKATDFVDYVFTNNVRSMTANQVLYGMFCEADGGVVDDLLVYKINDEHYYLVVNASNIDKDLTWLHKNNRFGVDIIDQSDATSEIAVQGPFAESMLQKATDYDLSTLRFFTFDDMVVYDHDVMVSRTGYTGEDGVEIYGSHEAIKDIFERLLADNERLTPCGLGCRDTLRFEVALPLYGNELSHDITPIMAGYGFAVSFDKGDFIGKDALKKQKDDKPSRRVVGLEMVDKGILRHGYAVYSGERQVGHITTGYIAPTTGESVAMALVDRAHAKKGNELEVAIRKRRVKVKVRNKKFYDKNTKQ